LLKGAPIISKRQDLANYETLSFLTGEFELSNVGGVLNYLQDEALIGNTLLMAYLDNDKLRDDDASSIDVVPMHTYFIEGVTFGADKIKINAQDVRKSQKLVPTRALDKTTYPNLADDLEGAIVPLDYGPVRNAPCLPLNSKTTGSTSASFRASELFTTLTEVRVKVGDTWSARTPSSTDAANGTFTIPNARATSSDAPYECVADLVGVDIDYASDVIIDLYERYLGIEYTSLNYDTVAWEAAETSLPLIGHRVSTPTDINKIIAEVQNGVYPGFRFDLTTNGKRTIKLDDREAEPILRVEACEVRNKHATNYKEDSSFLYGAVTVAYDKEWNGGKFKRVTVDDYAVPVIEAYQIANTLEVELLLTNLSDAEDAAAAFALDYSAPAKVRDGEILGTPA